MDVCARRAIISISLLSCIAIFLSRVQCAMLWFEEPPSLDDPCTSIVISTNYDEWEDIHPPENCLRGGIVWYATFGSVRIWFRPGTETEEGKRQKFELCLTAGSNDRVAIWWEKDKETWGSIVYPLRLGDIPSKDRCRKSVNGSMHLFLMPINKRFIYMTHLTYNITLLDEAEDDEVEESIWSSLF